jgi:hypothetical protein
MKDQLVLFETAKLAEQKDFNGLCLYRIHCSHFHTVINNIIPKNVSIMNDMLPSLEDWNHKQHKNPNRGPNLTGLYLSIPTQSLLQKWLREKHKIDVGAYSNASGYHWDHNKSFNINWFSGGIHIADSNMTGPNNAGGWDTYEDALEAGLVNALNLLP